jgi:hypothetical protein
MDLSRPIMASTRARTCSFFCIRLARSEIRTSWRWRSARFSSLMLEMVALQLGIDR